MPTNIRVKRATRAQLTTAAGAGNLAQGEPYLVTDEGRLAIGTGTGAAASLVVSEGVQRIVVLTQAAYDALSPPDANTLYVVTS